MEAGDGEDLWDWVWRSVGPEEEVPGLDGEGGSVPFEIEGEGVTLLESAVERENEGDGEPRVDADPLTDTLTEGVTPLLKES